MNCIQAKIPAKPLRAADLARMTGQQMTFDGIVFRLRRMSGFSFVLIQLQEDIVQGVISPDFSRFPETLLRTGMACRFVAEVVAESRSRAGFELQLLTAEALSEPVPEEPPVVYNGRELSVSPETLLDRRPLTLRHPSEQAIFRLQAALCTGMRRFLEDSGFLEVHTPKIVSGGAEGGADMFRLEYFGRKACLAQSPQLYKQMLAGIFGRVYEIGPIFRAEPHDTARHLNEYTGVDLEMRFIRDFRDLMELEAAMLAAALAYVRETCPETLEKLKIELPSADAIPTLTFAEAKRLLNVPGAEPDDFSPEEERLLGARIRQTTGSDFVFVTHYPSAKRPFYAMDTPGSPGVTESFDLLFRGMEITTGGQRIHDYDTQLAKMRARGVDPAEFTDYLTAHRYGLPPHGGLGLGLERFTARLAGFDNVRRASLFPRDTNRLTP